MDSIDYISIFILKHKQGIFLLIMAIVYLLLGVIIHDRYLGGTIIKTKIVTINNDTIPIEIQYGTVYLYSKDQFDLEVKKEWK
jgi:hypothetical protein